MSTSSETLQHDKLTLVECTQHVSASSETLQHDTLTSVKTDEYTQNLSTSSEAMLSLQKQTGETAVSSLGEVSLPPIMRSPTNYKIKCPLSNVNIMLNKCDHNGVIITSECGDLRIIIPEGAIGVGDVIIGTSTSLYGPYSVPVHSKTDLIMARCSPYYWIGVFGSYTFHKPIQVEFEHYGGCDPSHYQLSCCEDDDESYTMRPVDFELSFTVRGNISWCTFHTYHFCSYCLYHDCKDHVGLNKIIALYLKPADLGQRDNFTVQIWFSFPISHCLRRNQELYTSKDMVLDDDCSYTFLTPSDKTCKNYFELSYHRSVGWYICYLRSATIQTEEVNFNHYTNIDNLRANEDISQFPPRFILDVTKNCECKNNLNMEIKVTLFKFGEMISKETVPFKLFVPVLSLIKYFTTNTSGRKHSMPSHECKVCTPELKDLVSYSKKISFYWKEIAALLGIQDKIDVIDMDNYHAEKKCFSMFDTWLKRTVNACWCRFIEALYGVGLNRVAEEAKTHIRSSKTATVPCLDIDAEEFLPVIQPVSLESKSEELKQPLQSISLGSYNLSAIQPISFESINEELTQPVSLKSLECESLSLSVQTTKLQLQMKPLSISEGNLKIAHDTLNLRNLIRYLKDIPDTDLDYFIYCLLPNDSAVNVIKDIKLNSGRLSKEDDVKKVCEAFLKIKSSSWTEVHRALVQADCYDLARIIEATFLTKHV